VVTREEIVAQTMRSLRNYGATRKYFHTDYGTNSRLDTLQAAILKTKLPHLHAWNSDRNRAAQRYDQLLQDLAPHGIAPLENHTSGGHVYHLYVVRITANCALDRDALQASLNDLGIQTGIHYPIPCHLQPAFQHLGYEEGRFPHAEAMSQEMLSLPMYPGLSDADILRVVDSIKDLVGYSEPQQTTQEPADVAELSVASI
jgi:dTDP-4-amino-4,6-dideoxygalactose transaminase